MATKSKFGSGMGEDEVAANQNWSDCIEKERSTVTQWCQDWGFLARGAEVTGNSASDIEKKCAVLKEQADQIEKRVAARYLHTKGNWQQSSNTIGAATWSEDTIVANAIWKCNARCNDPHLFPTVSTESNKFHFQLFVVVVVVVVVAYCIYLFVC